MKKGKVLFGILISSVITIALIFLMFFNVFEKINTSSSGLTDETVNATVTLGKTEITLNEAIIQEDMNTGFSVSGKDLVTQASKLLGAPYTWAGKGGKNNSWSDEAADATDVIKWGVDCSGLVSWAMSKIGYNIDGLTISNTYSVPKDAHHWVLYGNNGLFLREIGIYEEQYSGTSSTKEYKFNSQGVCNSLSSTANDVYSNVECTVNGKKSKINVLKVNDPITSDYRYYNYYDKNGNKKTLPMGTVIYAYAGKGATDHSWIYIGDLGTNDRTKAIEKLKELGIINKDGSQDIWVEAPKSDSTHWRIEAYGEVGVRINNGNPNQGTSSGDKKIGAIWAFQIANDYQISNEFDLALKKIITEIDGKAVAEDVRSITIDASNLVNKKSNDAIYNMRKKPIQVEKNSIVKYRLQVFNESKDKSGYAKEITDYIPKGMIFVNSKTNATNLWKLYKSDGTEARWSNEDIINYIVFLYQKGLKRTDSAEVLKNDAGLLGWYNKYINGTNSLENTIFGILGSKEANNQNDSNEDFVKMLYDCILLRNGNYKNDKGLVQKIERLNNKTSTRTQVITETLNSIEFNGIKYSKIPDEELNKVTYVKTNILQNKEIEKLTDENSLSDNSKSIEIELEVKNDAEGILTNISEITKYGYKDINNKFVEADKKEVDRDSEQSNAKIPDNRDDYWGKNGSQQKEPANYPGQQDDDDFEKVIVNKQPDMALKKTIVKVQNSDKSKSTNYVRFDNRRINTDPLKSGDKTTAGYYMNKDTVQVTQGDYVTYRIYIFNEGSLNATASKITDTFLSANLEYDKNDEINKKYGWGDATTNNGVTTVTTEYLKNKLIERFKGLDLNSAFVEIRLKVKNDAETNLRITNIANISEYQAVKDGRVEIITKDIDSEPNNVILPNNIIAWEKYTGGCNFEISKKFDGDSWHYVEGQDRGNGKKDDDDDFDSIIVNPMPEFDLALRKFITAVNDNEVDANKERIDRVPIVKNGLLQQETTAGYCHTKDAVTVENEDIVTYTIRVYNEGDLAGKATKITDYLPDGLEFLPEENLNKQYKWNEETINGKRCITTDYLNAQNALLAYNGQEVKYVELKVKLKVNVNDKSKGQYLTNRAEISEDVAFNSDWSTANVEDRDSMPADMTVGNNLVNTYYNERVTNGTPRDIDGMKYYYEANHDDEDFDTVYVKQRTKFDVNLLKVATKDLDNNTPTGLNGAKFDVVEVDPNNISKTIGEVSKVTTTNTFTNIIHKENCKVSTTYVYKIEETEAPNGFEKIIDIPLYIEITVDENGNISENSVKVEYNATTYNVEDFYRKNVYAEGKNINIKIANNPNKFDLALRKFITGVNNYEIESRYPQLNVYSYSYLKENGTIGYYHTKQAIRVNQNDIVTYTIRVYNEGQVKGYATEITDHLPNGLEFVENSQINIDYGWNATKNSDGTTTVKTNKLNKTLLNECGLKEYLLGGTPSIWYADVKIQCKVVPSPSYNVQYLTNRAEISNRKAVSIDQNGNENVLNLIDEDSPDLVTKDHKSDMLNYDQNELYNNDTYYPGFEDDDDKETVYINPVTDIEFSINKIDNVSKESIAGAKFRITPNAGSDGNETPITAVKDSNGNNISKNLDGTYTIPEGGVTVLSKRVDVGKTNTYYVQEIEAPTGYEMGQFRDLILSIKTNMLNGDIITNSTISTLHYVKYEEQDRHIVTIDKVRNNVNGIQGIATLDNNNKIMLTVENKNTDTFDLALRKYITNVSNTATNKNENYSRQPILNISSLCICKIICF
ncbi:MAG TPA: hypothetical protein DCZ30_03115 [Clostridiales bacterium]|nr:hypothetical protein [Clostridiales bacterium]